MDRSTQMDQSRHHCRYHSRHHCNHPHHPNHRCLDLNPVLDTNIRRMDNKTWPKKIGCRQTLKSA